MTYNTAGTAKIPASRTRHPFLWVGLWVEKCATGTPIRRFSSFLIGPCRAKVC
jgi:hypothetical protein